MKQLIPTTDYDITIEAAKQLTGTYIHPVIFHCFWYGTLSEKHLLSIKSCYKTNKNKIILWLQNVNDPLNLIPEIQKYAEVKMFDLDREWISSWDKQFINWHIILYSDLVRMLLLYNYGGVWFDLDIFFLRSFEPLFATYSANVCVYQWETQNYPNNAIVISLQDHHPDLKIILDFLYSQRFVRGYIPSVYMMTYDVDLPLLVLPCSWFDGSWIPNPYESIISWDLFFKNTPNNFNFTLDNFFPGAFCYHWHNRWLTPIDDNSPINQLSNFLT